MIETKIDFTYRKKTKLIATLGPASDDEGVLESLIANGVNVVRLNMSHGNFEEQGERIVRARKIAKKLDLPISILLDTKGPEIRTHNFKDGKVNYKFGKKVFIESGKEIEGTEEGFSMTYKDLPKTVKPGQEILFDDGKLSIIVDKIEGTKVIGTLQNSHALKNKKAVNIPGADLSLPFVSEYDKSAIE
jgi:pyruvate kinase